MLEMTGLKVHRFDDCEARENSNPLLVTADLRRVTCCACKASIVNTLLRRDWATLSSVELESLDVAALETEEPVDGTHAAA